MRYIPSSLEQIEVNKNALALIPKALASKLAVFPLALNGDKLSILSSEGTDPNIVNDLRFVTRKWIDFQVVGSSLIYSAIERFYEEHMPSPKEPEDKSLAFKSFVKNGDLEVKKLRLEIEKAPIVKVVNKIITQAINMGASDIHLEPFDKEFKVRYRIDGMLQEMESLPPEKRAAIVSRVKVMAEMDIAERRLPQDGRIRVEREDKVIDIRVSTLPTDFGEKVVLRILDKSALKLDLENLGFDQRGLSLFKEKIKLPYGMILVTGPTGSGKTTTLYAALNYIKNPNINIITIEDPIEYNLEGINQSQVKPEIDFTFANALRSFLRQDPNVIMVGEIRDYETMEIAIRAAMTGHLVFSTLHTNDAPTAITRLLDMQGEPFLVSSSVTLVLAQRLVRKICPKCKHPFDPSETLIEKLGLKPEEIRDITFYRGSGCPSCNNTGYRGRIAVFEIMPISSSIAEMIANRATAHEIKRQARKEGMLTLREDALNKLKAGLTTPEEVLRETSGLDQ
jgi:type IV pilus assembly protein PilB